MKPLLYDITRCWASETQVRICSMRLDCRRYELPKSPGDVEQDRRPFSTAMTLCHTQQYEYRIPSEEGRGRHDYTD